MYYLNLKLSSFFVDLNHFKFYSLSVSSLIVASKNHNFVSDQAEALLLRNFQHQVDQALLMAN